MEGKVEETSPRKGLSSFGLPYSILFILIVELCERFVFYNLSSTQKVFFEQAFGYSNAQSTSITTIFNTTCYLSCIVGGILGDAFWGRYQTIGILSIVYVIGTFLVAVATYPAIQSQALFFAGAFAGVALGTGGIKPLVCNFGADQIIGEDAAAGKERFFSYFYWMINVGALIALGLMSNVATAPESLGIPEGYGFFTSYGIAALAMALGVAVFFGGSGSYVNKYLTSRMSVFAPVIDAFLMSARQSFRGKVCLFGWSLFVPFFVLAYLQAFADQGSNEGLAMAWAAFGVAIVQLCCLIWCHCDNSFLVQSLGQEQRGGVSIEEIRLTFQTAPQLILANIIFNFSYSMMLGPFLSQSCQMDLRAGSGQISGAMFNVADCAAIIIMIPVMEYVIYPSLESLLGRRVSLTQKVMSGFGMAALSMISATVLEWSRRSSDIAAPPYWSANAIPSIRFPGVDPEDLLEASRFMGQCVHDGVDYCSNCAPTGVFGSNKVGVYMSSVSGWWMAFPFALIGLGEILVNPALYYYAYSMTPERTKSIVQAFNLVFQGAYPPALVCVLSTVLARWQPTDLNNGRLEFFYFITLAVVAIGSLLFFWICRTVRLQQPTAKEPSENDHLVPA